MNFEEFRAAVLAVIQFKDPEYLDNMLAIIWDNYTVSPEQAIALLKEDFAEKML